jgi:hypothetical protein
LGKSRINDEYNPIVVLIKVQHTDMHYNPTPKNRYKESLLNKNVFAIMCELVPGRGSSSNAQDYLLAFAEKAALGEQIQA